MCSTSEGSAWVWGRDSLPEGRATPTRPGGDSRALCRVSPTQGNFAGLIASRKAEAARGTGREEAASGDHIPILPHHPPITPRAIAKCHPEAMEPCRGRGSKGAQGSHGRGWERATTSGRVQGDVGAPP